MPLHTNKDLGKKILNLSIEKYPKQSSNEHHTYFLVVMNITLTF